MKEAVPHFKMSKYILDAEAVLSGSVAVLIPCVKCNKPFAVSSQLLLQGKSVVPICTNCIQNQLRDQYFEPSISTLNLTHIEMKAEGSNGRNNNNNNHHHNNNNNNHTNHNNTAANTRKSSTGSTASSSLASPNDTNVEQVVFKINDETVRANYPTLIVVNMIGTRKSYFNNTILDYLPINISTK
jgi:hypothetical protein